MKKIFFYLVILLVFIFGFTLIMYRLTFFPQEIFIERTTPEIEFKKKLPVIAKGKVFRISQLKDLPVDSVVLVEGRVVSIKKMKSMYEGEIEDLTGKVKFLLPEKVLSKNPYISEIIDDAVYMDVGFSFLVKVKKGYVEVIDIM